MIRHDIQFDILEANKYLISSANLCTQAGVLHGIEKARERISELADKLGIDLLDSV